MPVCQYLDLSTGHLPASDLEKLSAPCPAIVVPHPYGWWIYVPSDDDEFADFVGRNSTWPAKQGLSNDFIALLTYARKRECSWINLDRDGDREAGLSWHADHLEPPL